MGNSIYLRIAPAAARTRRMTLNHQLLIALFTGLISACSMSTGTIVYDKDDRQVGLQPDPTVTPADTRINNSHPAQVTPEEIRIVLGSLMVSGWSGTLVGLIEQPRPLPVFAAAELELIAEPIALAFQQATPFERVWFSLPKLNTAYSEERTTGALFLRGRYLHVVVTDHSAFTRADTAGGEVKDPRDTKGMKLWVSAPATAATVPDDEEPRWAHFETVHLSLNVKDVIALRGKRQAPSVEPAAMAPSAVASPRSLTGSGPGKGYSSESTDDLRLQIRELTTSNLELRQRLEKQQQEMQGLQEQLLKLQQPVDSGGAKTKPARKAPVP